MATYDAEKGAIVVRIVYDGAALAGKTTSLRALAAGFGRPMFSGDEAEGRTLFFDWVDFVGGRFEGSPIRCQIVSVPGQAALEARRRRLLDTADAVVLVVDSTVGARLGTRRSLEALREVVGGKSPPVGVIVQANKRDDPDALPVRELEELVAEAGGAALTETIASSGEGIRETFVFAVRLALDRVRELDRGGALSRGAPDVDSGEELLAALRRLERIDAESGGPATLHLPTGVDRREHETLLEETPEPSPPVPGAPRPPGSDVEPGNVWPPVDGRTLLHEAERARPRFERTRRGDWAANEERFRWHSALGDLYDDQAAGREALLDWARRLTAAQALLSPRRAIVLAPAAPGAWRLWQVAARYRTLHDSVREALVAGDFRVIADQLWRASEALVAADRAMVVPGHLHRVGLTSLAELDGTVVFAGLLSPPSAPRPGPREPVDAARLLRRELEPLLAATGARDRPDIARVVDRLLDASAGFGRGPATETLAAMLIGH